MTVPSGRGHYPRLNWHQTRNWLGWSRFAIKASQSKVKCGAGLGKEWLDRTKYDENMRRQHFFVNVQLCPLCILWQKRTFHNWEDSMSLCVNLSSSLWCFLWAILKKKLPCRNGDQAQAKVTGCPFNKVSNIGLEGTRLLAISGKLIKWIFP